MPDMAFVPQTGMDPPPRRRCNAACSSSSNIAFGWTICAIRSTGRKRPRSGTQCQTRPRGVGRNRSATRLTITGAPDRCHSNQPDQNALDSTSLTQVRRVIAEVPAFEDR